MKPPAAGKTFWDVDREKTHRIILLFAALVLFYLFHFGIVYSLIKLLSYAQALRQDRTFRFFGWDTVIVVAFAAAVAGLHWYLVNRNAVAKILLLLEARHPDRHDQYHRVFENVVDELAAAAGGISIERFVLPTGAMNAFALSDLSGRRLVGVTEGLLSRLSRAELQAVVAHEVAHVVSNDSLLTTMASSLFGIYGEMLDRIGKSAGTSYGRTLDEDKRQQQAMAGALAYLPVISLMLVLDLASQFTNLLISREKETRADANAVKYSRDPLSLASALYKIARHWRGSADHLAPIFILSPQSNPLEDREDWYAVMFSTHPPLTRRLQMLLEMGHASVGDIARAPERRHAVKTELASPAEEARYQVEHGNAWNGPFTLLQLLTLDWLNPDTRLRICGEQESIPAREVPMLRQYFAERGSPLYQVKRLCPQCREWLVLQAYEGLYVWRCAFCQGTLVEQDKLPRIFVRHDKGFSPEVQRTATLLREDARRRVPHRARRFALGQRPCAKCGQPMERRMYSYAYYVEIDACNACRLVWFDKDELEILQCLIEYGENER